MIDDAPAKPAALKRRLGLVLLVLYGTGITVGAGIYVLIGAVAGHAGIYTPWAFGVAAIVMGLTVASYIELSTRFPVSAGEAAYVKAAFNFRPLSTATGLFTVVVGLISASTVTLGSVGYVRQFVELPQVVMVIAIVVLLGAIAGWGILESVVIASLFTLIEVGGLVAIIVAGIYGNVPIAASLAPPPFDPVILSGVGFASLLAFFAFIGFEDLANVVEEIKMPYRDLPRAMILTLLISTCLYISTAAIAVSSVSLEELSASSAPLSLVFQKVAGVSPMTISAIAIFATLNTILAQMTLATRVLYGMARQGDLPSLLGRVHTKTSTPLVATVLTVFIVIALALTVPFERLAESTSLATLAIFALVNLSLLRLRYIGFHSNTPHISVPIWVPWLGLLTCLGMIASALT
ncbi:MAG: amino acid permease [Afipia sp.]|nr:amino acid permease [Afipia sp.]